MHHFNKGKTMLKKLIHKVSKLFKKPQEEVTFEKSDLRIEPWPFPVETKKKRPQVKKATTRAKKPVAKKATTVAKKATKKTAKSKKAK
jgi:hypothetical protein